ncbi:MAG: DUF6056 family protein [Dysgonomonas sp.]
MNILQNILKSKILLTLIALTIFVIIYVFNTLYPLYSDDWIYSFRFENSFLDLSHSLVSISDLSDIFESQYNHYYSWGGRSVVHFIDQILLWINPTLADFFNSIAYIGFIYIIYRISNSDKDRSIGVFILVACLSWLCMPQLVSNVFWITGSANYLWGYFNCFSLYISLL